MGGRRSARPASRRVEGVGAALDDEWNSLEIWSGEDNPHLQFQERKVSIRGWNEKTIWELDKALAQQGIPFRLRPMKAVELLGRRQIAGTRWDNPDHKEIIAAYNKLIPETKNHWPGMGIGLAASVDQVKKLTVPVVFGTARVDAHNALGFSNHYELWQWCRNDDAILGRCAFSFADLLDLTYGMSELKNTNHAATEYWRIALSNLETLAITLSQQTSVSAITQALCMTVELSIKGSLILLGQTPKEIQTKFGHKLIEASKLLSELMPHRDNELLLEFVDRLPPYVSSRYEETRLTRLKLVNLAVGAQFVASSAIRRVSARDVALEIETSLGKREKFFREILD